MHPLAKTLCALALLGSTAAAPVPQQFGIGVHILPGWASLAPGAKIIVENQDYIDVDVECIAQETQETQEMVFSGTVYAGERASWNLTDSVASGDVVDVYAYESGTSTLVTNRQYSVQ